jgi:COP9 signalosome complex subunit 1
MASHVEQSPFFEQQKVRGELVVKGTTCAIHASRGPPLTPADAPKFDLESYIANYSGRDCGAWMDTNSG